MEAFKVEKTPEKQGLAEWAVHRKRPGTAEGLGHCCLISIKALESALS